MRATSGRRQVMRNVKNPGKAGAFIEQVGTDRRAVRYLAAVLALAPRRKKPARPAVEPYLLFASGIWTEKSTCPVSENVPVRVVGRGSPKLRGPRFPQAGASPPARRRRLPYTFSSGAFAETGHEPKKAPERSGALSFTLLSDYWYPTFRFMNCLSAPAAGTRLVTER